MKLAAFEKGITEPTVLVLCICNGRTGIFYFITIVEADYKEVEMILVGNHAPFTWGKNGHKAVYNAAVLEQVAKMAWLTEQINPNASKLKDSLIRKHYERKHGPNSYYGQ